MSGRLRLYSLFAQIFVFQAGFGLVTPLLPLYTQQFAVGTIGVGFVVAIYGLARVLTDLPAARLAAWLGHSKAMGLGALIVTVGSVLTAFADSFPELLIYRFISGIGAAITLVVGQTMAATNPGPYTRGKAIGYYQAWFLAGVGIGPMLSGPLDAAWGPQAPFLVYAALAAIVGVVGLLIKQPAFTEHSEEKHASIRGSLKLLLDVPFLLVSAITLVIFFTRTGGMQGLVPLLGSQNYRMDTTLIGLAVGANSVVNLIVTFIAGMFMDRFDRRRLLVPGSLLQVASLVIYAVDTSPIAFFTAASLWGVGTGLAGPVTAVYVAERSPGNITGALALYRMISDIGYLLGPILMGLSAAAWGIPITFLWCGALLAIVVANFAINHAVSARRAARLGVADAPVEEMDELMTAPLEPGEIIEGDHIRGPLSHIALGPLDAPRMVFVHPNPMDSSTWLYQMAHFSTWYRCISVDLPGYGWSGTATAGVTMTEVAEAVWAAVDRAGGDPDSPVVIVGCSIGSHIAEYMYWARPESSAAIVLSGTGYESGRREFAIRRAAAYRKEGVGYRWEHAFEDFSPEFRQGELAHWYADLIAERAGTADADTIAEMFESRIAPEPEEFITELAAPVLILTGELDSAHQRAFDLAERLPDAKLITIEGAGHACYYEQPLVFDHHMLDFLRDRLPAELRPTPELAARFGASSVTTV